MTVLEMARVDRLTQTYDLAALFPALDGPFTAADVALLPPRANPTAATAWVAAGVTAGVATVLFAGPDASSSGAIVVTGSADVHLRVTDGPETDTVKVGRIILLGGGVVSAGLPLPQVVSVQGRTGAVTLTASDVGADAAGAATAAQAAATLYASTGLAGKQDKLVPTGTKTATYTASPGDLAIMNVAGGGTVLNLPAAPADKTVIGYRAVGATTAVPLTVNRGGTTDTIGTAGATSVTVPLADETLVYQYDAPNTRWLAIANVKTLTSLDSRYLGGASKQGLASALVDAGGTGTHTDLQSAIAASATYATIHVISDLTHTAPITPKAGQEIVFWNKARLLNNGTAGTDTFQSGVADGANGSVADVKIRNARIARAGGATGNAGKAFNFHGALAWSVYAPVISGGFDNGLYFDASPYPSGQGSHNTVYEPQITSCVNGINFAPASGGPAGSGGNINQVLFPHTYSCTKHVWQQGGIDSVIVGLRAENLGTPVTTPLVVVDAGVLYLRDFHIEGERSTNPFQINGGSIYGNGDAYTYNGGGTATSSAGFSVGNGFVVIADAVDDMDLDLKSGGRYVRNRGATPVSVVRSRTDVVGSIAEWSAPATSGGAPVVKAAIRSDGNLRLPPRTTDPGGTDTQTGDVHTFTTPTGAQTILRVKDGSTWRQQVRADLAPFTVKLPDITANTTKGVHRALCAQTLSSLVIVPDGFVAYTATDFWTINVEEWNGNTKVGTIATFTQSAQLPLSATSISLSSYALASGRHVRVGFVPTGAPPAIPSPLVQLLYTVA